MPKPNTDKNVSFRITNGKGFQLTFANGYTASVQFGAGNYCDAPRSMAVEVAQMEGKVANTEAPNAEFLAWDAKGKDVGNPEGYQTAEQILERLNAVAALPSCL